MTIKLTREGFEKLQKELEYLRTTKRQEVIKAIAEARAKGDLRENAEYDAARDEQGHLEKRIAELQDTLSSASILDESTMDASKVYLGAKVLLKDLTRGKELAYTLVNKEEARFAEGKLSTDSPVGKALLSKSVGDEVEVTIPAGTIKYKIMKIER